MIHLTEPFNNSELFLIGSMNRSDIFANRTRKLIQEVKPDTVFVQTEEKWWKGAEMLGHIKSTQEMDLTLKDLQKALDYKFPFNLKKAIYDVRWNFFHLFARWLYRIPLDINPFAPGLEVKYALEEATKLNAKIVYLGYEFDKSAAQRFYHENRYTIIKTLYNYVQLNRQTLYSLEFDELYSQVSNYGLDTFIESSCDQYFINW